MNFELINPSDPYTMRAPSFEAAVLACWLISPGGMMPPRQVGESFEDIEGGEQAPFAISGDLVAWFERRFGRTIGEAMESIGEDVISALRSVMIGSASERRRMERVLSAILDPAERERAAEAWHDQKRSSLNDIGSAAREIAAELEQQRKAATEEAPR